MARRYTNYDHYCVGDAAIIVDLLHNVAEESYIQGATEQRAIDIYKACEWLNLHTNWGDIYADGEVEMLFRKAMEE